MSLTDGIFRFLSEDFYEEKNTRGLCKAGYIKCLVIDSGTVDSMSRRKIISHPVYAALGIIGS